MVFSLSLFLVHFPKFPTVLLDIKHAEAVSRSQKGGWNSNQSMKCTLEAEVKTGRFGIPVRLARSCTEDFREPLSAFPCFKKSREDFREPREFPRIKGRFLRTTFSVSLFQEIKGRFPRTNGTSENQGKISENHF